MGDSLPAEFCTGSRFIQFSLCIAFCQKLWPMIDLQSCHCVAEKGMQHHRSERQEILGTTSVESGEKLSGEVDCVQIEDNDPLEMLPRGLRCCRGVEKRERQQIELPLHVRLHAKWATAVCSIFPENNKKEWPIFNFSPNSQFPQKSRTTKKQIIKKIRVSACQVGDGCLFHFSLQSIFFTTKQRYKQMIQNFVCICTPNGQRPFVPFSLGIGNSYLFLFAKLIVGRKAEQINDKSNLYVRLQCRLCTPSGQWPVVPLFLKTIKG